MVDALPRVDAGSADASRDVPPVDVVAFDAPGRADAGAPVTFCGWRYGGGAMGAQVETPAPTMRNPMLVMYRGSMDPSDGR